MSTYTYDRKPWSLFAPTYTYEVRWNGHWIGEVARNEGERRWWASNKTWTGGGDLPATFGTRGEAAHALRHAWHATEEGAA